MKHNKSVLQHQIDYTGYSGDKFQQCYYCKNGKGNVKKNRTQSTASITQPMAFSISPSKKHPKAKQSGNSIMVIRFLILLSKLSLA
jgi:hypothetical protein